MKRILYVFAVVAALASCGVGKKTAGEADDTTSVSDIVQDTLVAVPVPGQLWGKTYGDYVFHDDFYYGRKKTLKFDLPICPDCYGLVIEFEYKESVLEILKGRGFSIIRDIGKRDFPLEYSPYCYYIVVKGISSIADLPHIIFSNHMYDLNGEVLGVDPTFFIVTDASVEEEARLMGYAKEHNVIYTDSRTTSTGKYYYFKCTNSSSGNPTEMANWFLERAGFMSGHCGWGDATVSYN